MRIPKAANLIVAMIMFEPHALACPAYLAGSQVANFHNSNKDSLRLFVAQENETKENITRFSWSELPLQIAALDQDDVLIEATQQSDGLTPNDRIIFYTENFTAAPQLFNASAPCPNASGYELLDPQTGNVAYLLACPDSLNYQPFAFPVSHDEKSRIIATPRFSYDYQPNNQLMYEQLVIHPATGQSLIASQNADMYLHLDVRRFFTLRFDNSDVHSTLKQTSFGPIGMLASLDFYMKVLFFKIDLKLATTTSFFTNTAHIPSQIDVPVHAFRRLNPGSGLLFEWEVGETEIDQSKPHETMPNADSRLIHQGWEYMADTAKPYCAGDTCRFRLQGTVGKEYFALDVMIEKEVVERGFFPNWVSNVKEFRKEMGWAQPKRDGSYAGIYFNNQGLPRGQYLIDQWIRMGSSPEALAGHCPREIRVTRPVSFPQTRPVAH